MRERLVMTKEDVKNFLHENKKDIAYGVGLTVTCVYTYVLGRFMYKSGYARGVRNVSNNVQKLLGFEKYEQLRVALNHMVESR